MTIQEGNKAIADFMGWKYNSAEQNWYRSRISWESWTEPGGLGHKELFFHSSWDWLMPVVKKIIDASVGLPEGGRRCELIIDQLCNLLIEGVHSYSVQFIQWYQKKEDKK